MSLLRPLLIAFSTYSALPLPRLDFEEKDMKHAMCFFPLVGLVVGLGFMLWFFLAQQTKLGSLLRAAGLVLVPLALTGGIHMDGFLDTSDALSSWQPREKKLDILKDVHVGAFAVIRAGMYLLALLGIYSEATGEQVLPLALGFVLSRCLSILMYNLLPNARGSGMLQSVQRNQSQKAVLWAAGIMALAACIMGLMIHWRALLCGLLGLLLVCLWFPQMARRKFGGITGDLAGYFLQMSELVYAALLVLLGRLV